MSKSAGTLMTTYNATYIEPRFMPGYTGHVPTMKFDYGETYGNQTAKYFQDYRSHTLNASRTNLAEGGYFPSFYSYNPVEAVEARTRTWDKCLDTPTYRLYNQDYERQEDIRKFRQRALAHREHYNDKSGSIDGIGYFLVPTPNEVQFAKKSIITHR